MQFSSTKDFGNLPTSTTITGTTTTIPSYDTFDDMPLPTSSKTNSITTKDEIAERSKTSSIAFSWGATPPNRKPSKATPINQSVVHIPAPAQSADPSNSVVPSIAKNPEVDQKKILDLENTLVKAKKDNQGKL